MSASWLRHRVSERGLIATAEQLWADSFRLALVAAHDDGDSLRVVYLFLAGYPDRRVELEYVVPADNPEIRSLAYLSFPAGRFEREMADLYGIRPVGHPKPRRLVRHAHWPDWHPMRTDAGPAPEFTDTGAFPFLAVEGPGVYEIPVGPVHAGLIEPGHFRFSVAGETIVRLKARLWFVHRGIEKLFHGRPATAAVDLAERISGDTSAAHALAHSLAIEDALGIELPHEVHRLRALIVELERLYNHAADLGALANDVGYSLANAHAQRIRENLLRRNAAVTGHRLLRGAIRAGGVALRALPDTDELAALAVDLAEVATLTLANSVVYDRFAGTAVLHPDDASALGCLGYVARASGLRSDARVEHPTIVLPITEIGAPDGDVLARYTVRRDEFAASAALAQHIVESHTGPIEYAATLRWARPAAVSASSKAGAALSCTASKLTSMAASPGRKSSIRPGSTGPHCRWRWPTPSSPTSRWPTKASTSPTRATTSNRERAQLYGPSGVSVYKHAPSRVRLRQTRSTVVKGRSGSLSWRRVRTGDLGLAVWGGREEYRAVKPGTPGIQPKGDMMTVTVVDAGPGRVSRSVEVAAPAAELFAIVADPRRHRELDGSGTVRGNIKVPAKLVVGSKFSTKMKLFGLPYRITSRVTALKPNELVEWSHPLGHRWRWEFESLSPTLTRVTETFDYHAAGAIKNGLKFYEMTGFAKSNAAGIEATLAKLSDQYARGRA